MKDIWKSAKNDLYDSLESIIECTVLLGRPQNNWHIIWYYITRKIAPIIHTNIVHNIRPNIWNTEITPKTKLFIELQIKTQANEQH